MSCYSILTGIIGIVIGFVLALIGIGWCCHVKSHMQEEMNYYHDTKLTRSASIRSGIDASEMASISRGSFRSSNRGEMPPFRHEELGGYDPNADNWGNSVSGPEPWSQDPNEVQLPRRQQPYRADDAATRISNKVNKGVKDFQNFVNRSTGSKGQSRRPYSDRLSGGMPAELGPNPDHPMDEEGNFDLARTYKAPRPQYHGQRNQPGDDNHHHPEEFGEDGGYANIPDTANAHLPRPQQRSASQGQGHDPERPHGHKKRAKSEAVPAEVYDEPQVARKPNMEAYKYHQGRPLDSSVDSENENTTLVYNPKDGQWYYYYKGRPVSVYTGNNPERDAASGPKYRYINGKPMIVTKSTENIEATGKSTDI